MDNYVIKLKKFSASTSNNVIANDSDDTSNKRLQIEVEFLENDCC